MKYLSTRQASPGVPFSQAMANGPAPDGGLYVPDPFPSFEVSDFDGLTQLRDIAVKLLTPFLEGDVLLAHLEKLCGNALNFSIPLVEIPRDTSVLELFHGPTLAFKDVGARFLASALAVSKSEATRTVLVATSGDTGGAVASAFFQKPGFQVFILFPKGRISARQERQLTCWGHNVRAFGVRGFFDDCQRMVKEAFADPAWRREFSLVSANSINVGRLLPQQIYYAAASLETFRSKGSLAHFVIPTGNLGNAVAALWAKRSGLPIGKIVFATNANRAIADYFQSGKWQPRATLATLANAMDVGNPSNAERLFSLYPDFDALKRIVSAVSVSDSEIRQTIREGERRYGRVWCPHTAAAVFAREQQRDGHWIVVATAHPAKFDEVIEPLIGHPIEVPEALKQLLNRPSQSREIEPTLASFRRAI